MEQSDYCVERNNFFMERSDLERKDRNSRKAYNSWVSYAGYISEAVAHTVLFRQSKVIQVNTLWETSIRKINELEIHECCLLAHNSIIILQANFE